MSLLERGSRGLAPSQMSAAGEIFQDLRYATLDPTLDQVQPFQNWPWTTLALHRMGDLGPRWATLDRSTLDRVVQGWTNAEIAALGQMAVPI